MAGKTNLTATLFAQKKLLAKTSTGVHRADNQEPLPSSVQVGASTIFSEDLPTSPSNTLFTVQSASNGGAATVEFVEFVLVEVTGSTYDANSYDPDAIAQSSGPHTYRLALTGSYQANSNNPKKGTYPFVDNQILHWSLGGLQLVPPTFSNDIPNPYTLNIYSGTRDVDDQIPLLDELDWQIDYYSGILFLQDYNASKIPTRAKGFIYVGKMLSASLGASSGGGSGTGVGWIAPSNGTISTTGSLLVGTNTATPGNAEISFSAVGAAVFNEQGRDADFRVEAVGKPNAIKVDANTKQVLILSGGDSLSSNEAIGTDINFYVSGSAGAKGGTARAITLFGGDLHISGSLTVDGSSPGGGGGDITGVTAGTGLTGGGNTGGVTLNIDDTVVATLTGSQFSGNIGVTGSVEVRAGLSGSLTQLTNGSSYLIAGSNVTITSASNGAITFASTNTTYTAGDGLDLSGTTFSTDLKSSGGLKIESTELLIDDSIVATLSGSQFTGIVGVTGSVGATTGLSGSLTRLTNGNSYLIAGTNITIASSSNGSITIGSSAGGGVGFTGGVGSNNQMITADGSGNIVAETNITFNGSQLEVTGSILPGSDSTYNLGSESFRFANIYTGDLHLKNQRGHWQIIEERDCLTVTNRLTGTRYKMLLELYKEDEQNE